MKRRIIMLIVMVFAINISIGSIYYFSDSGGRVTINLDAIGATYPEDTAWVKSGFSDIDTTKDAVAMFLFGLENFEKLAPYAVSAQSGEVKGRVLGQDFSNVLSSTRIYGDGAKYWNTATISSKKAAGQDIRSFEEAFYQDGTYYYQLAEESGISIINGEIAAADGYSERGQYAALGKFVEHVKTDPGRLSMHTFSKSTIKPAGATVYDKENGVYEYSFSLDLVEGVNDYATVVEETMRKGGIEGEVVFKKIFITVIQWDNGLIKEIKFDEEYKILWISDVDISMTATTYFSYDKGEPKYQVADYAKRFSIGK